MAGRPPLRWPHGSVPGDRAAAPCSGAVRVSVDRPRGDVWKHATDRGLCGGTARLHPAVGTVARGWSGTGSDPHFHHRRAQAQHVLDGGMWSECGGTVSDLAAERRRRRSFPADVHRGGGGCDGLGTGGAGRDEFLCGIACGGRAATSPGYLLAVHDVLCAVRLDDGPHPATATTADLARTRAAGPHPGTSCLR
ncbi:Uncharacterised protein [Mycobacteroides abscessus subsp. abscessus]|nr:Uncharacterised protein [Mycobacteroides abscessus subsp. abscessus]